MNSPLDAARPAPVMISPLSDADLKAHVVQYLSSDGIVPEGKTGAVVAVVNLTEAKLVVGLKTKQGWEVDILGSYDWTGEKKLEASVTKVW